MNQLLGKQHPASLRDGDRRCTEMLAKQPAELPLADFQPIGKRRDIALVERAAFDQFQRPRNGRLRAAPGIKVRRTFGSAAQAGPEARCLCRGGRRHERAILELRRPCRANRPAVDAGRLHAGEKPPIVAGIAGLDGSVTNGGIEIHNVNYNDASITVWRFSDFNEIGIPSCAADNSPVTE